MKNRFTLSALLLVAVSMLLPACATTDSYSARVQVWAARDLSKRAIGENPIGVVLVTQPLPLYMELHYQHISSIPMKSDPGEMNAIGAGFCIKIPLDRCNK